MKKAMFKAIAMLGASAPLLALAEYDYDYDYGTTTTTDAEAAAGLAVLGGMLIFWIIAMVIGLAFFIFWIVMLVDCVKREFEQRSTWLAVLIVSMFLGLSWLAAIIYYFMVKRKNLGTKPGAAPAAPTPPPAEPKQ